MISKTAQIQLHYELSMSIGTSMNLQKMLRESLSTLMAKLNCLAGGVHFFSDRNSMRGEPEKIISIPQQTGRISAYQWAVKLISSQNTPLQTPSRQTEKQKAGSFDQLPVTGYHDGLYFAVIELPGLGIILLINSESFDLHLLRSLRPIFLKLSVSCNGCLYSEDLVFHQQNLKKMVAEQTDELRQKNKELHQEIENRKTYEGALRRSEAKYRELVQSANSIILRWDTEGKITFFNEYAQLFFGYAEDEILGRHVVGTIVPEAETTGRDLGPLMADICKNPDKYQYNVNENMRKDGSLVWVAWTNRILRDDKDEIIGTLSIGADVTERYNAELRFKLAAEAITDLIYEWDVKEDTLRWFGDIDSALGYDTGEFPQTVDAWLKRIHPDDLRKLGDTVKLHSTSIHPLNYEYRLQKKDGTWVHLSDYAVPVLDAQNNPVKWIGACNDITEKKKAEQELIEGEERYRALFTNEIDAISIFEPDTKKFVDVNDAWLKLYGYERSEIPGLALTDITVEPEKTDKAVAESARVGNVLVPERRHRRKDGSIITVEISEGPFTWKGQNLMYALIRDITERKIADDKLKESEQLLAETQKLAQLGSWEFDVEKEEIKWSEETFRIAGKQSKDTITLNEYIESIHPEDLPKLQQALERSTAEQKPYELELRHRLPDGSFNTTLTKGKPVIKDHKVVKYIGSVLDITERKRAERELKRANEYLENVLESSPDAIGIVDSEGNFVKWNKAAAEFYGFSYEELSGKSFADFYPNPKKLDEMLHLLRQESYISKYEIDMRRKDGGVIPIELSISLLKEDNDKTIGSVCIARDLSETRKTLAKLTSAYEQLQIAKEEAETANKAKSAFLANMSHELRTPLNAIIGFSELMTRDPGLSENQLKDLETIIRSGEHLLSLINDVLEFSKIEADQVVLQQQELDLYRLLSGLQEMFHLRARQKGLFLNVDKGDGLPQFIRADQSKLRQILINLLGNAIKFTPSGGVALKCVCSRGKSLSSGQNCMLRFEIQDTGIGIAKNQQKTIFEAFSQIKDNGSIQQGTGLGLSISQKFVSMMGGNLELESDLGRGSKFSFGIPVEVVSVVDIDISKPVNRVTRLKAGQEPVRLLVVEDNDYSRQLLVRLLQSVGFQVREAVNGKEAVEVWEVWKPHLVWMDMRMPIMNGYEATSLIKERMRVAIDDGSKRLKTHVDTKIIAITASAFEQDRIKVLKHGGDDFVRKPYQMHEIFSMLTKHLGVEFDYSMEDSADGKTDNGEMVFNSHVISSLKQLPKELLSRLQDATELSDAASINQIITDIIEGNNQLGQSLLSLAENFAYDEILEYVQQAQDNNDNKE